MFSQAFTSILTNDLAALSAFYTGLSWGFDACSDGSKISFVGEIPSSIPNTNNLRLVITIPVDDADVPTALTYPESAFTLNTTIVPNLNAPTVTVNKGIDLPAPEPSTSVTFVDMATTMAYCASITDLLAHI